MQFVFFFSQEWRRVNKINIYEVCNQAPKCSRYEVYASIQTRDAAIVKETGVYKILQLNCSVFAPDWLSKIRNIISNAVWHVKSSVSMLADWAINIGYLSVLPMVQKLHCSLLYVTDEKIVITVGGENI